MSDIAIVNSKNIRTRAVLVIGAIICLVAVWFGVRWQVGNMVAVLTPADDQNAPAIGAFAVGLAPADPAAWTLKAASGQGDTHNDYRRAVELSPFDYRLRTQFGRVLEQVGELDQAHQQLLKAVELAPSYAAPRWQLGNFYLRRGRESEAIAELKLAARGHRLYRDQVYSLVWDYFGRDADRLADFAGSDADGNIALAYFLAGRGRGEQALSVWNKLSDVEKAARQPLARSIAHGLFIQRVFPQALEFSRQLGMDPDARDEAVTNGSFEQSLDPNEGARFGWQIARNDSKLEISLDNKTGHEGSRSLRISFKGFTKPSLLNVVQTVAVQPSTTYRLGFWFRTESLRSAGMPLIEIIDANADTSLVRSPAFPTGTAEWQPATMEFTTSATCNGITLRLIRNYCGDECPLNGTVWLDDFVLTRK